MDNSSPCFVYSYKDINFELKHDKISALTNKDFLHTEVSLFKDEVLSNPYVRTFFQEYIKNNSKKIKQRVNNYLDSSYRETKNYDLALDVFSRLILSHFNDKIMFEDILKNSSKDVFNHFLSIIFISQKEINDILKNTLDILQNEKEFLDNNEFHIIFEEEFYNFLKNYK